MANPDKQLLVEAKRAAYWCRAYAAERGISLDALAVYAGVGRSSITRMAHRAPSLRTLSSIAAYFDVQVSDLLKPIPQEVEQSKDGKNETST